MENEIFTHDLFTRVLEATVIQLIAKCFQSLWLAFKYIYMCIYMYTLTYIYTHIYMFGKDVLRIHPRKKKIKKQCGIFYFSVLFEIVKSDSEPRAVTEGTSLCLWPVLSLLVTRLFGEASGFPSIQAHGGIGGLAHGASLPPSASGKLRSAPGYFACLHGSTMDFSRDGGEDRTISFNTSSWEQPSSRCSPYVGFP